MQLPAPPALYMYLTFSTTKLTVRAPGLSAHHNTGQAKSRAPRIPKLTECIFFSPVYNFKHKKERGEHLSDRVCSYDTNCWWTISNTQPALLSCCRLDIRPNILYTCPWTGINMPRTSE